VDCGHFANPWARLAALFPAIPVDYCGFGHKPRICAYCTRRTRSGA
jgi:hypothetical protein